MKKRLTGFAAIALSFALLFSACSSDKKKEKEKENEFGNEEVAEAVENYFKQLTNMSLSKITKYAEESAFSDLDLKSDEFDVLNAYIEKVKFEVTEAEGKEKKGTGTATVEITYVDLDKILDSVDDASDVDELVDAINNKKAKTKSDEVELEMTYDDKWIIADDEPVYELLMDSFEDVRDALKGGDDPKPTDPTTDTTDDPTIVTTTESTTESTTEATTTTSEDTEPSDSYETQPEPAVVDRHLISLDEIRTILTEAGLEIENETSEGGRNAFEMLNDDETFNFIVAEFDNASDCRQYYEMFEENISDLSGSAESDEWQGNTHHYVIKNISDYDNHTYELYLYRDETALVLCMIDTAPGEDVPLEYYEAIEKIGLYDIPVV